MADYTESSKAKALAMAMNNIDTDLYDIVVIMDADNVTVPEFLSCINRAFDSGVRSIQAHRTGKNLNTDISILDSASEEINNGFFRSGHNALGLSAGLSAREWPLMQNGFNRMCNTCKRQAKTKNWNPCCCSSGSIQSI